MIFMGSKYNWGQKIVDTITPWIHPGGLLVEPFVGAAGVCHKWRTDVLALDSNPHLITLWRACQAGWRPPPREAVTKELHAQYKANPVHGDPMTAYLLFGCSFRGVWRGGFCHNSTHVRKDNGKIEFHDFVGRSTRLLLKKIPGIARPGVQFEMLDYRALPNPYRGLTIYADPPYKGTSQRGIGHAGQNSDDETFNSPEFWAHADWWAHCGARVFVSEQTAPSHWIPFRSWTMGRTIGAGNRPKKTEILWVHCDSEMALSLGSAGPSEPAK